MEFDFNSLKFDYNSPVILTYLFICLAAWFINWITRGWSNKTFFESYRSSPLNPLTYIRLITHSIGHKDFDHLVSNFLYILLVGPMIEEKYGSINLIIMLVITSLVIAIYNILFSDYAILGASGNVYMLIVLSSFANISEGKIPLTVILILIFYVIGEMKRFFVDRGSKSYHDGHLIGAVCGLIFGLFFLTHTSFF